MKVLLIGAGAVGQVYGYHLQKGGADIAFYVKEKYAAELRGGVPLYPLKSKKKRDPIRFEGFDVLTSLDEVRAQSWDQLWLCISSTAMRGDWLEPMLDAIGDTTAVVSLQPGLEDRDYLLERLPESRLVNGAIAFSSYQAPLDGETVPEPGIAYYLPPLTKSPFSGPREAVDAVVSTLKRGKCGAKRVKDAPRWAAQPSAITMPHLAGLEAADWQLTKLRKGPMIKVSARASRQALVIASNHHGGGAPFKRHFIRPTLMKIIIFLAPKVSPFPFQTYLEYHFTKVGDQTRLMLQTYIDRGSAANLPSDALAELLQAIG